MDAEVKRIECQLAPLPSEEQQLFFLTSTTKPKNTDRELLCVNYFPYSAAFLSIIRGSRVNRGVFGSKGFPM